MSYELYTIDNKCLGGLATNKGLDDLQEYLIAAKLKNALTEFVTDGESNDIEALRRDVDEVLLRKDAPAPVEETLKGLKSMLASAEDYVLIVS